MLLEFIMLVQVRPSLRTLNLQLNATRIVPLPVVTVARTSPLVLANRSFMPIEG